MCTACGQPVRGTVLKGPAGKFGLALAGLLVLVVLLNRFGPNRAAPAAPPPAPVVAAPVPALTPAPVVNPNDHKALVANVIAVISLRYEFEVINRKPQPDDADWKTQMEQNARDLKAATLAGEQYTWPEKYRAAQAPYRAALADFGYIVDRWPAAIEAADQNTPDTKPDYDPNTQDPNSQDPNTQRDETTTDSGAVKTTDAQDIQADCTRHLEDGDVNLSKVLHVLGMTAPNSLNAQSLGAKLDAPPSKRLAARSG